jgi:hypothetical protein
LALERQPRVRAAGHAQAVAVVDPLEQMQVVAGVEAAMRPALME